MTITIEAADGPSHSQANETLSYRFRDDQPVVQRRRATYVIEYLIDDANAVIEAAFGTGQPGDRTELLSRAITELLRPPLIGSAGITLVRAHRQDGPVDIA